VCIAAVKVKQISGGDFDSVEREIRLCDKVKALELLGKHFGIFEDNINVDVNGAVKIVDDIGNNNPPE
jgi:phage terminase small subunit